MPSRSRLDGALRLARTYVDADRASFVERELAWAVLRLSAGGKGVQTEAKGTAETGRSVRIPDRGDLHTP